MIKYTEYKTCDWKRTQEEKLFPWNRGHKVNKRTARCHLLVLLAAGNSGIALQPPDSLSSSVAFDWAECLAWLFYKRSASTEYRVPVTMCQNGKCINRKCFNNSHVFPEIENLCSIENVLHLHITLHTVSIHQ